MKWTVYNTIKSILLVAYGLIMGPWALEAIDPIAIAFRIVVALTIIVFGAPVWCWFEDGINLKDRLE